MALLPVTRLPTKSGVRPSSGAARLAGGGCWANSIQLPRTGGLRPGDWGGDGSSPHPATASSPPGPSGLPSSDLPPVPGLQSGAPPGVAFAHVPTLSIALSVPASGPWTLDFSPRSSPDLNLSLYLWVLVLPFGLGCAAGRRSAGESASRCGAARRRNGRRGRRPAGPSVLVFTPPDHGP
jgi:hypothetical protein